TSQVQIIFS
ncbi:hypothetical protein D046_1265B, partial [Vibrio parahaemolyticus V-223/04]